jgi:hypothetical protein
MSEAAKMRLERIQRLMSELEYEIVRGVMEREIEPAIHLTKQFPCSGRGDGTAWIDLHVYAGSDSRSSFVAAPRGPKLRLVSASDPDAVGQSDGPRRA